MKILVIDDKQENLEIAKKQLMGHEVTTASSYDEAEKYLAGKLPHIYACGRWDHVGYDKDNKLNKYEFDIILTDLFLPASTKGTSYKTSEEVPYGLVIAMTALRLGIPVAIVTDTNHHAHPILWAMDMINTTKKSMLGKTFEFQDEFGCGNEKNYGQALEALTKTSL